jgi:predicted DNA-binding transcriptional regulator AlpA
MSAVTRDELLALPPVIDLPTAADALGIGRSAAYELVRMGQWPTPVVRLGRLIRVPTEFLFELLGLHVDEAGRRSAG